MEYHLSTCSGHFLYFKRYFQSCWFSFQCCLEPNYFSLSPLLPTWSNLPSPLPSLMKTPSQLLSLLLSHSRPSGSSLFYMHGAEWPIYILTWTTSLLSSMTRISFRVTPSPRPPPPLITVWLLVKIELWGSQFLFPGRTVLSYFLVVGTWLRPKNRSFWGWQESSQNVWEGALCQTWGNRLSCTLWASRGVDDHRKVGISWSSKRELLKRSIWTCFAGSWDLLIFRWVKQTK